MPLSPRPARSFQPGWASSTVIFLLFITLFYGVPAPQGQAAAVATMSTNGQVRAIATYQAGGSTYAVGCGNFTQASGKAASGIAVWNLATSALKWGGNLKGGWVDTCIVSGNTLYAGGTFKSAGTVARRGVAAFTLGSFKLAAWNPNVGGQRVYSLSVDASSVYVARSTAIQAVSRTTGAQRWARPVAGGAPRTIMAAPDHNRLYVGGGFTVIANKGQAMLAALSLADGRLDSTWRPALVPNTRAGAWPGFDGQNVLALGRDTVNNRICGGIGGHGTNAFMCWSPYSGAPVFRKDTIGDVQAIMILGGRASNPGEVIYYAGYHRSYRAPVCCEWIANAWTASGGNTTWGDGFSGPKDLEQSGPFGNDGRNGGITALALNPRNGGILIGGAFTSPGRSIVGWER